MLPLNAPSVRQQLNIIAVMCSKARIAGPKGVPTRSELLESNDRFKSALAQLCNFCLTSQFLALLGGCRFADNAAGWTLGKLPSRFQLLHAPCYAAILLGKW